MVREEGVKGWQDRLKLDGSRPPMVGVLVACLVSAGVY